MNDKKITSYLFYAMGEITLVVIGILLALELNAWSEKKQNQALVEKSLTNLMDDLNFQLNIIDIQHVNENNYIDYCEKAILSLSTNKNQELEQVLLAIRSRKTFVSNKVTFNNMKENKIFTYLNDDKIKNSIINYYQNLDYTERVINNNNLYIIDNQFGQFLLTNPMNLSLNSDGSVNYSKKINKEKKYQLKLNIDIRKKIATRNIEHSNVTKDLTIKLITQIKNKLSDEE